MKNLLLMFALIVSQILSSQTTIYSENFGTVTSNTSVSSFNGWQNSSPITYTGNVDVRRTQPSSPTPNDDNANVFFTNSTPRSFTISGINTSTYSEVFLTLNHFKTTTAGNNQLLIQVSSDGINYTTLSYSRPTGDGTAIWRLISPSGTIPITNNLRIRFTQTSTSTQFRIDDIKLTYDTSLPVELISFEGYSTKEGNLLIWKTASEHNSDYYVIESSVDGEKYTPVDKVVAAGNSNEVLEYSLLDKNYGSNIIYYRLVQYDFDGKNKTYGSISVINTVKKKKVVKVTNMMGQEVNEFVSGGIYLEVYEDGSINRVYK